MYQLLRDALAETDLTRISLAGILGNSGKFIKLIEKLARFVRHEINGVGKLTESKPELSILNIFSTVVGVRNTADGPVYLRKSRGFVEDIAAQEILKKTKDLTACLGKEKFKQYFVREASTMDLAIRMASKIKQLHVLLPQIVAQRCAKEVSAFLSALDPASEWTIKKLYQSFPLYPLDGRTSEIKTIIPDFVVNVEGRKLLFLEVLGFVPSEHLEEYIQLSLECLQALGVLTAAQRKSLKSIYHNEWYLFKKDLDAKAALEKGLAYLCVIENLDQYDKIMALCGSNSPLNEFGQNFKVEAIGTSVPLLTNNMIKLLANTWAAYPSSDLQTVISITAAGINPDNLQDYQAMADVGEDTPEANAYRLLQQFGLLRYDSDKRTWVEDGSHEQFWQNYNNNAIYDIFAVLFTANPMVEGA